MSRTSCILLVEDDQHAREGVAEILDQAGWSAILAENVACARSLAREHSIDIVLSDIRLPDGGGMELAVELKRSDPDLPVVLMTAYGSVKDAVHALQSGVDHYLTKPLDFDELRLTLHRLLESRRLKEDNRRLRGELGARYHFQNLVGQSVAWQRAMEIATAAAATDAPILLVGESGTGKELTAHAIHHASRRNAGPFVAINCAAIPDNLLESELFGYEPGAFTGAVRRYGGKIEMADGGTLLLDEVGDMPLELQAKLLRVIEDKTVVRLGGTRPRVVDFRVIASTNQDLSGRIADGRFREELYYRINVLTVDLPPLRDRKTDIPMLVDHFLSLHAAASNGSKAVVEPSALDLLVGYFWPGNVRELEHFVSRVVLLARDRPIDVALVRSAIPKLTEPSRRAAKSDDDTDLPAAVRSFEAERVREALTECAGNRTRAAQRLGISLRTLQYKMKQCGIE